MSNLVYLLWFKFNHYKALDTIQIIVDDPSKNKLLMSA